MAAVSIEKIPLHTIVLPVVGLAAWLFIGKAGSASLAVLLGILLIGNVVAAVHHAELIALRTGEPFGTLVLAFAVTVIEVGLIVSMTLGGKPNPTLLRESVHAVVMLVLHGLAGLCIVISAFRQRAAAEFRQEGANAFLAVLIPMATLVLVLPNALVSVPGPFYSPVQLGFVSVACVALYAAFLFIQTNWHRTYFLPEGDEDLQDQARPGNWMTAWSMVLLVIALLAVVLLAKGLSPVMDTGLDNVGAPAALSGVIVAAIVLLPETAAAIRSAARNRLQASINLSLGSGVASIGLAVPAVAMVSLWIGQPLELGISPGASMLMALGFVVAIITYGMGRASLLSGLVHLVLLATYLFTIFAP